VQERGESNVILGQILFDRHVTGSLKNACQAIAVCKKLLPMAGDAEVRTSMNALRRIVRALRLVAAEVERDLGISVAQLFVLQALGDGEPRSINEIAEAVVSDPSTISGLTKRLVEKKLVHRGTSAGDARRAAVSLTAGGVALLKRAPTAPQARLVSALSSMRAAARKSLAAGLVELAERLGPVEPTFFFEDEPPERR
jgi:DNA-binding MarR family transcriptional regulator